MRRCEETLDGMVQRLVEENKELKELIANAAAEDYYGCYEIIQEYVND
jgi:hypothetical protein